MNQELATTMTGNVASLSRCERYSFSKHTVDSIQLIANFGVEGDVHAGELVRHRYDRRKNPNAINRRQIHLVEAELLDELAHAGFSIGPGQLGENMTTRGLDLLTLPVGTRLKIGAESIVELTGLRAPCVQIDGFQPGLRAAASDKGRRITGAASVGVMGIIVASGEVRLNDAIQVTLPPQPWRAMVCI